MRLLSPNAARLIAAFLDTPSGLYGYELLQETGMKSGSLYPILGRFERLGWIRGQMQDSPDSRPQRRVYTLDPDGAAEASAALERFLKVKNVTQAELNTLGI